MLHYQALVWRSVNETEDALAAIAYERQRLTVLRDGARAHQSAVGVIQQLYTAGLRNFDGVLQAQRTAWSAQDEVVQSERRLADASVSLYYALGGGWEQ